MTLIHRARTFALVMAAAALTACGDESPPTSAPQPTAADAFVWGYPLVVTQRTLQTLGLLVGVDHLYNQPALSSVGTRFIVSPNVDTLYSAAVVDLRSEPMVLTVPDVLDRYWVYQFLDAWTTTFHYVGTRATGGEGGQFVITPPGWKGALPAGAVQVASPTPQMFLLGRYLVDGDADVAAVAAIERTLVPLSTVTKTQAPPPPPPLGTAPGTPQEVGTTGGNFFDELGDALAVNPPGNDVDRAFLQALAPLGIGPGAHPYAAAMTAGGNKAAALDSSVTEGMARISAAADGTATAVNGWVAHLDIGAAASDTLLRAAIADVLWGANLPEEAVYARSAAGPSGDAYTGAKSYVLHFDKGNLPPVDAKHGFWSVTLYGPDHFFVDNPLHRYALGDRTPGLAFNADGSLDLYIQSAAPSGQESNWLPAPPGPFELLLRLYLPGDSVRSGTYVYPPVTAQ